MIVILVNCNRGFKQQLQVEEFLSNSLGRKIEFEKIFQPLKEGDVPATYASTDKLQEAVGFKPENSIEDGLQRFADWYVEYYGVK